MDPLVVMAPAQAGSDGRPSLSPTCEAPVSQRMVWLKLSTCSP